MLTCDDSFADPVPIVRNSAGDWVLAPGMTFPVSNLILDLRRIGQLPDHVNSDEANATTTTYSGMPGDDRLFVILQGFRPFSPNAIPDGTVQTLSPDGTVSEFFSPNVPDERSLVDFEFHPQFSQPGMPGYRKVYTVHQMFFASDNSQLTYIGTSNPGNGVGDNLVAEWEVTFDSAGLPNGVDPSSYREVFRIVQPDVDHPIGQIQFNPYASPGDEDFGLLYIPMGDGFQIGVAQDTDVPYGKILRVNPLQNGTDTYSVPATNPFVGEPQVLEEIYSVGHRNPHNLVFARDQAGNTHIMVGEIGASTAEIVNMVSGPGGNYGWDEFEGTFPGSGAVHDESLIFPVVQYGHDGTGPHAIAAGYLVDNGSQLDGRFFLGDFPETADLFSFDFEEGVNATLSGPESSIAPAQLSEHLVTFDHDDDPGTPSQQMTLRDVIISDPNHDGSDRVDIRFGQGPGGELYILNKRNSWVYLVTNSVSEFLLGDVNRDDSVNLLDVAPFVALLSNGNFQVEADINGDGFVNLLDIGPFVDLLSN